MRHEVHVLKTRSNFQQAGCKSPNWTCRLWLYQSQVLAELHQLACRRQIEVDIFSIGLFKFKGVTGSYQVVQLLPQELRGRNEHFPANLSRGKAVCMQRDVGLLGSVTVSIPDPSKPHLHCGWYQSTSANPADDHSSFNLPAVVSPTGSITEKGHAQAFARLAVSNLSQAPPRSGL